MEKNGGAAPTGCYKCGRPGHWSRDCPLSSTNPIPIPIPNSNPNPNTYSSRASSFKSGGAPNAVDKASEKPKRVLRTRPKLTPDLLLSNDGLGYVLRHFPRSFKFRGRGHEVSDLGNLIGLYTQWHSHLLPYYSFDQFVHKVEQVGATKRVRTCIRDLRERVANGGDPSKLHEQPTEHDAPNCEPGFTGAVEAMNSEGLDVHSGEPLLKNHDAGDIQEDMFDEIYKKATEEPCQSSRSQMVDAEVLPDHSSVKESPNKVPDNGGSSSSEVQITEDQKARMVANRLKALERAAARAHSSQAT